MSLETIERTLRRADNAPQLTAVDLRSFPAVLGSEIVAIRLDRDVSRRIDAALAALGAYADSRRADRLPQRERDDALRSAAWQALDDLRELLADRLPSSRTAPRTQRR
jgi:hypothetical protein